MELLLSIAIAVVAVTLAFSIFRTVSLALRGQEERARGYGAAATALDRMRSDLLCAFVPDEAAECEFKLAPSPGSSNDTAELSFCAMEPMEGEPDIRWAKVTRVTYRAERTGERPAALTRVEQPLSGPEALAAPRTNVLVGEVARFDVRLWDGSEWLNAWSRESSKVPPQAARIHLVPASAGDGAAPAPLEIYIPAGMVITSSFERTGAAAP